MRPITDSLLREAPLLHATDTVAHATRTLLESDLPALPAVDDRERLAGIFGEREFMEALFPQYLKQLHHAGFVKRGLEKAIEKRQECRAEPISRYMNTEHVDVGVEFSDVEVAEIFLHHRVLLVPVVDGERRVTGVITRTDFFRSLAERF